MIQTKQVFKYVLHWNIIIVFFTFRWIRAMCLHQVEKICDFQGEGQGPHPLPTTPLDLPMWKLTKLQLLIIPDEANIE